MSTNEPTPRRSRKGATYQVAQAKSEVIGDMPRACADEALAVRMLERLRWGGMPFCPHCASVTVYKMRDAKTGERNRRFLWRCRDCKKQYTWRIGTVAEESLIPARIWIYAYWRAGTSKKGISALELRRQTGLTHKSALFLLHRIRWAMTTDWTKPPKIEGTAEVDECYVGGGRGTGKAHGVKAKSPVVALLERGVGVRTVTLPKATIVTAERIGDIFRSHVAKSAVIYTDASKVYPGPARFYASLHESVNHDAGEYARGDVTTNRVEGFFGTLKRGLRGFYHAVSEHRLPLYVSEFEFRYNHRFMEDGQRVEAIVRAAFGKRLMYRALPERSSA